MESICNVPSIEEISFKLTENVIPSTTLTPLNHHMDDSLDYTLSKTSIQNILLDLEEDKNIQPEQSIFLKNNSFIKNNSLKTTCTGTTTNS